MQHKVKITGKDYIRMLKVLKCFVCTDLRDAYKRSEYIHLKIGKGLMVGYSTDRIGVAKFCIRIDYIGDIWDAYIKPTKVLPSPSDTVCIKASDKDDLDKYCTVEFGEVSFKFDRSPLVSSNTDFENMFNILENQYLESLNHDRNLESPEDTEDEGRGTKYTPPHKKINTIYLSPKYLYKILSSLQSVDRTKIRIDVEDINTKALRISTRELTIYLLPMRPDEYSE